MKPVPEPVEISDLPELAHRVIREAKFPMLATVDQDGQPRVRPVSPVRVDDDFTVYIANLRSYQKTTEIENNPRVEISYLSPEHDQIRITGEAHVLNDAGLFEEIWNANPLLKHYLGSSDNPELIIYVVQPTAVRFMREWALEYHQVPLP